MKTISQADSDAHYSQVLKGGAIGGAVGLGIGIGGVALASHRYPAFRSLTLPFRTFLVTSSATFGAVVTGDRYSIAYQRGHEAGAGYQDAARRAAELARADRTAYQNFMEWGREHRYQIVFASWLASMGVAMAMVGRAPMSTAHKLVQARVYAQGLTLGVLIVSAAFEVQDANKGNGRWETVKVVDPDDPEHKRIIEKRIHKEEYEGQDLWKDMVAAEERRLAEKKRLTESNNSESNTEEHKSKA